MYIILCEIVVIVIVHLCYEAQNQVFLRQPPQPAHVVGGDGPVADISTKAPTRLIDAALAASEYLVAVEGRAEHFRKHVRKCGSLQLCVKVPCAVTCAVS